MKIDGPFYATVDNATTEATRMKDIGYDGVYTLEGNTDPFFPLVLASQAEPELDISTAIAVGFPRNPLHLAYQAWDLQKLSRGKFYLGLGSQVKAHIERRFGIPFSPPAPRMKELIQATKAFFDCFQNGSELNFQGKYYQHSLMTPMFNAGPNPYGIPPILLGAVGPRMTRVAGEVADGLIVHPFHTMPFLQETQMPVITSALAESGRSREDFLLSISAICITGNTEEEYLAAKNTVKGLLGFYGSTPAYRPPMEAVGLADLQPTLNRLSKAGKWEEMGNMVSDEFVEAFAVCGPPETIAQQLWDKYGSMANRLSIYAPYQTTPDVWPGIIAQLKQLDNSRT
ncbi:MAG: TIGR03617 family F420-dependent LLM class oxidoreductase [Pseudomonadales bacterium]